MRCSQFMTAKEDESRFAQFNQPPVQRLRAVLPPRARARCRIACKILLVAALALRRCRFSVPLLKQGIPARAGHRRLPDSTSRRRSVRRSPLPGRRRASWKRSSRRNPEIRPLLRQRRRLRGRRNQQGHLVRLPQGSRSERQPEPGARSLNRRARRRSRKRCPRTSRPS